jgi:hypothetical protein
MSKHIFFTPEVVLHGTQDELSTEFAQEYYQMFDSLDLSSIPRCNDGIGASGYDQHAMIKAFIVYTKEGYRSILQLIRELKAKPGFSKYVLGFKNSIPDDSTFYRFLKAFSQDKLLELCAQVNKAKLESTKTKLSLLAIDAKPIVANAKDNNPKCFVYNLSDKTKPPKRNEESALGYLTSTNDINGKAKKIFFWGYKMHLIVDAHTDTPLVWKIEKGNRKESSVTTDLYKLLKTHYSGCFADELIQLADKGYDERIVYESFYDELKGLSIISKNSRNSHPDIALAADGSPLCKAGRNMMFAGSWYEQKHRRLRYKFRCPHLTSDCKHKKSSYGCSQYLQITDPIKGEIKPFQPKYSKLYPKRQSVERVNAYLTNVGVDFPKHFAMKSIENLLGFALLANSLSKYQILNLSKAS